MKKLLAVLLAVALMFSFAACKSDEEKAAFPVLLRYINTFWWYSLSELETFSKDVEKVEKMLDWFELQMTRNDITLT